MPLRKLDLGYRKLAKLARREGSKLASALSFAMHFLLVAAVPLLAPSSLAQSTFVPPEFPADKSNEFVAEGVSQSPAYKWKRLDWYLIPDPLGTREQAVCVEIEIQRILSMWLAFSKLLITKVREPKDANFIISFSRIDETPRSLAFSHFGARTNVAINFFSSASEVTQYWSNLALREIDLAGEVLTRVDTSNIEAAFYVNAERNIEYAYVWRRGDSITGDNDRTPRQSDIRDPLPYGYTSRTMNGCGDAEHQVLRIRRHLLQALGVAQRERMDALKRWVRGDSTRIDGTETLIARILFDDSIAAGDDGSILKEKVGRLLERVRSHQ